MNNRTWIKKIREQHQFISLVKCVICWVQECCKKEMCTVVQKLCKEAFHWVHWLISNLIFPQANEIV